MIFEDYDRIVFAGDSITDMGRTKPVGEGLFDNVGRSYVRVVENMLNVWYPQLRLRITNMGISGNTSRDLLGRWQTDVVDLQPQWVSICIGVNDVWRQFDSPAMQADFVMLDEYEKNVETMIVSAKGMSKGVFVMSPYYMEPNKADSMRARMDEYGAVCKKLAQKHGVVFIDLQEAFDKYFQYRHSSFVAWDRVHPNQIGATLIAKEFLKYCGFDY